MTISGRVLAFLVQLAFIAPLAAQDGIAEPPRIAPGAASAQLMPLVVQARQLFDQGRFADAVTRLDQVLAADPHNEIALRLRAISYLRQNRLPAGRVDLDELLRLKPKDVQLLSLRAITAISMSQPAQAAGDAARALELDPNNAMAHLARGMVNKAGGRLQDAVADFDRAIALNPRDSAAFTERGQAHIGLRQTQKALADFDQALVLNQNNDLARASRGLALLTRGSTAEGLLDIKSVLERNPNNQIAQMGQGLAMLVSGQYDRSIVALNQLVGKSVALDTFARLLRARAFLGQRNPDGAMADLNSVLTRQPDNAEGLLLRGMTWSEKRDYAKALDDLSGALAKKETVEGYFARARTFEASNNPARAERDYRRATELAATSVFDAAAQAESRQKIRQLSRRLPCGTTARPDAECL